MPTVATLSLSKALREVGAGVLRRSSRVLTKTPLAHVLVSIDGIFATLIGRTLADWDGYANDSTSSYNGFVDEPVNDPTVFADINIFSRSGLDYPQLAKRIATIRRAGSLPYCVGNLSVALHNMGGAYAAGTSGAATLLTLMPGAGALVGSSSNQLWVLYKLCPLAGLLTNMLSLGATTSLDLTNNIEDYTSVLTAATMADASGNEIENHYYDEHGNYKQLTDAEKFAIIVRRRAQQSFPPPPRLAMSIMILFQCIWIAAVLGGCYVINTTAIVVWLCEFASWSFCWYVSAAVSSIVENFAGVPYSTTWNIRVWRSPRILIDPDAPWVIQQPDGHEGLDNNGGNGVPAAEAQVSQASGRFGRQDSAKPQPNHSSILTNLTRGYSTSGKSYVDPSAPWRKSDDAFYVLLSVKGISRFHATLRILSKFLAVGVFTFGTAMFSSTTLVTITAAMLSSSIILGAVLCGRITAMFMESSMMASRPIVHRVVSDRAEADAYLDALLRQPGLAFEILGNIIVDGRCVRKVNRRMKWSSVFGILARPYHLMRRPKAHTNFLSEFSVHRQQFDNWEMQRTTRDPPIIY